MKYPVSRPRFLRALSGTALFEKVSLFFAMYVVTVSLFWFETGMLSKGLIFGLIAATLKTGIAQGHAKIFRPKCDPSTALVCAQCEDPADLKHHVSQPEQHSPNLPWVTAQTCQ